MPSIWPVDLNLYVPIPVDVVPIPIIDDLTNTSLASSFSKLNENTPVDIPDVKLPMKLDTTDSSESVKNSDKNVRQNIYVYKIDIF